ncbi:50S ribosomal protein L5 [Candidatus Campbellbacteria bacterium CG11_big_fil_rev_8_21_14_0_20_44_21]|uniref:Large ribosomal subunit protein uL5 n=1 Tax=Candidatus Campbellbacteria bacterium CG22_combo_CG10-13_8_21_14_all_43_18 TaxID=1974530 RepID=A0A2H0DXD2_9BACT|nr:MAG: 50S ribosomal protein L5 [Candidatus Campbellbacteria bacterium CG22_combo_CG10-13_8_21_14_all_43_18]PIR24343.1 MAG: 50S ribosomal protein L5 [Candidatus Campbellbacteria bacterium CG11_big_fil_rev_8_21_14_0_20_44_21]
MKMIKDRQSKVYDSLKGIFGYKNKMQTPAVVKVVVSSGIGSLKDKQKAEIIPDRLSLITGQKASPRPAKKSIASFKLREGSIIGYQVTLRGAGALAFLDKLINIALPRTRDFRGLKRSAVDEMGNLTIGVKEHTIFPETSDEELKNVFGMSVTVVTTAKDKTEALKYLEALGFPFKKEG